MTINGVAIADEACAAVSDHIKENKLTPHLTVVTCAPTFATQKFLALKKRRAEEVGVRVNIIELDAVSTTEDVLEVIAKAIQNTDGLIVQLPFPSHINIERVLASVPESHDVDAIGAEAAASLRKNTSRVLPPVVASIACLLEQHSIAIEGKEAVVVGRGRLVGAPAATWLQNKGAHVTVVDKHTVEKDTHIQKAELLVLGAGVPGLIVPEMIQEGVILFDAGTSEAGGRLVGDADPACERKASLFTPVPGGIGPITVVMIFKNLLALSRRYTEPSYD